MFSMMRRKNHLLKIDPDFDTDFFNIRYRHYYKDEIVKLEIPLEQLLTNIKYGVHIERNPTILSFLEKDADFSYSGRGSGIPRVIKICNEIDVKIQFSDNKDKQYFTVIFYRK